MNTFLVSLRLREEVLERAAKVAEEEHRSRAHVLKRWIEEGWRGAVIFGEGVSRKKGGKGDADRGNGSGVADHSGDGERPDAGRSVSGGNAGDGKDKGKAGRAVTAAGKVLKRQSVIKAVEAAAGVPVTTVAEFEHSHDSKTCRVYGCLMCKAGM